MQEGTRREVTLHHLWCLGFLWEGAKRPFWEASLLLPHSIYFGMARLIQDTWFLRLLWNVFVAYEYGWWYFLMVSLALPFLLSFARENLKIGCEINPTPAAAIRAINPSSSASILGVWCNSNRSLCHSFQLQAGGGHAVSVHLVSCQSGQIPRVHNASTSVEAWFGTQWNSRVFFATVPSALWSTWSCSPQVEMCFCQQSLEFQVFGKRSLEFFLVSL